MGFQSANSKGAEENISCEQQIGNIKSSDSLEIYLSNGQNCFIRK